MNDKSGPAFPTTKPLDYWGDPNQGMSLRDYFASEASRGAADVLCDMLEPSSAEEAFDPVQQLELVKRHAAQHAMVAYIYADAMLKAREL